MKAWRLSASCVAANDFLPIGAWTMPLLSTRNSILPAFSSFTAFVTSIVTVPALGFGISPRGPRILPSAPRSEEHTSELQSHHDLVCSLLLEKKKKKKKK